MGSRWAYMGRPDYNPPNNDCPECASPSRVFFIGAKSVAGVAQRRYQCEHGHEWIVKETLMQQRKSTGIVYVTGDASLVTSGVIAHVCNDVGAWGAGFTRSLSKAHPTVEAEYRRWSKQSDFDLGENQIVQVSDSLLVCNMVAQHGLPSKQRRILGDVPLQLDALDVCLLNLSDSCRQWNASTVHMPRIGCGLAGGKWEDVEPLIQQRLGNLTVFVYDLP